MKNFLVLYIAPVFGQINKRQESQSYSYDFWLELLYDLCTADYEKDPQHYDATWEKVTIVVILLIFISICYILCSCCCCCFRCCCQRNQKTKFAKNKAHKTQNTINRLSQLMALFETHNLELSFKQFNEWSIMGIGNVSININIDVLDLKIVGYDTYGKYKLNGSIQINKDNKIVCFLNKVYENSKIHEGKLLYYTGVFDERILKFEGKWYYEKGGLEGEWEGQFI